MPPPAAAISPRSWRKSSMARSGRGVSLETGPISLDLNAITSTARAHQVIGGLLQRGLAARSNNSIIPRWPGRREGYRLTRTAARRDPRAQQEQLVGERYRHIMVDIPVGGESGPVRRGPAELDQPADPRGRIRQHEGPKRRRDTDPGLLAALDRLVEPDTRGDPDSPLRWTCKSTRELAQALTAQGHPVSDDTVGRLLKQQGYRLQRTAKTLAGARHADRDAQFRYLNEQARAHLAAGQPVVSVDAKKGLVGRFANGGREWRPSGEPERVNVHDVPDPTLGEAI